ncbi:MAG: type II-A CRISPR-associated protein Csn2 [Clostridia bacterium]|nr:type II-A CRISPR-associated protein Csn2 [Clostridia bacterium]
MIKAIIPHVETDMFLDGDHVQTLIIENAREFYNVVSELSRIFEGEEGNICFFDGEKELSPSNAGEIVLSPINIDFNDKKIVNLLYKYIEKNYFNGEHILTLNEINSTVGKLLQNISIDFPAQLSYNEISLLEILKASGLKFELNYESLIEKIICYLNILIALKNIKFFVFVNIKSYLSDEDILFLSKHCKAEKIGLFLIEGAKTRTLLKNEKAVIITEDLCEIVENYEDI